MKVLVCAFACLRDPDTRFGLGKGGESGLGWNIIFQLSRFGEVFVLTDIDNKHAIEEKLSERSKASISFYYIGLPKFLFFTKKWIQVYAYLWQIKAYIVAKKLYKEKQFDVFHHITYANDWMASYIGALLPIPYIRGPGGGAHRVPRAFLKDYSSRERLVEKVRSVGQWIFRHDPFFIIGQNKAKAVLVCNREAFNGLHKKWQKKAYFYPVNGVSAEDLLILNEKIENKSDKFCVLSAGKLIKIKGFDLSIRAFKAFNDKVPNAKFIIIGEGPELKHLKKLADDLKLGEKIVFESWIPREKLLHKMSTCSVFLFPSLRDGGGNVVVEAMAVGVPVVCFDLAGPGFHINDSCGIKIKPDDPKQAVYDMAKALEKLYFNKELRDKLGRGARERAEREYNWEKLGDKLNKIYKEVL